MRSFVIPIENYSGGVQWVEDPELGYRMEENQLNNFSNGYFNVEVRTNDKGFRDEYNASYGNPGIIAIGDSYTFGHGIEAEDTWPEQLQNKIKLNVVNLGVSGYAPWQYEYVIRRIHQTKQPVKVVLYAMSWNDAIADQRFEITEEPNSEIRKRLENKDAVVFLKKNALYEIMLNKTAIGVLLQQSARKILSSMAFKTTEQQDRTMIAHLESTKEILQNLSKYLENLGARLIIVHIGTVNFVMTDRWKDYSRRHNFSRYVVRDTFAPWADLNGIQFRDALGDLENRYLSSGKRRTSIFLPVDNHYNKYGNEEISKIFYEILNEEMGLGM